MKKANVRKLIEASVNWKKNYLFWLALEVLMRTANRVVLRFDKVGILRQFPSTAKRDKVSDIERKTLSI